MTTRPVSTPYTPQTPPPELNTWVQLRRRSVHCPNALDGWYKWRTPAGYSGWFALAFLLPGDVWLFEVGIRETAGAASRYDHKRTFTTAELPLALVWVESLFALEGV